MELTGRTAVVTGGAIRLGRAIALRLAEAGMHIVVHYGSSADEAEQTCDDIRSHGVRATSVQADLMNPEHAADVIFQAAEQEFGGVDVLVNSATIFEPARLADTSDELFDRHLQINLKSPFFLAKRFVAQLGERQEGAILNIADWRATHPDPNYLAYTLTKSALVSLTEGLAKDLAPRVHVNAIAPGAILPPPDESEAEFEKRGENNLLGHTGSAADIAEAAIYLLESNFITGHLLYVNGGEHLKSPRT